MPPTLPPRGSSDFTYQDGITLKEYVDLRFSQAQLALELASKTIDAHLAQLNEFKEALQDQTTTYATRNEVDLRLERWVSEYKTAHEAVVKDIKVLHEFKTNKSDHELMVRDVNQLKEFRTVIETKASQSSVVWAYILAGVSILISIWEFIRTLN